MIALVQRVSRASVSIEVPNSGVIAKPEPAAIGIGLLIFLGIHRTDTPAEAEWLAARCSNLRIFPDDAGKMNRSLLEINAEALVVSQFTLYGDASRGNRPSFVESAPPDLAEPLYCHFVDSLAQLIRKHVQTGEFGAMMRVELVNNGPVTIILERRARNIL